VHKCFNTIFHASASDDEDVVDNAITSDGPGAVGVVGQVDPLRFVKRSLRGGFDFRPAPALREFGFVVAANVE